VELVKSVENKINACSCCLDASQKQNNQMPLLEKKIQLDRAYFKMKFNLNYRLLTAVLPTEYTMQPEDAVCKNKQAVQKILFF
jgi:hypothetical protein